MKIKTKLFIVSFLVLIALTISGILNTDNAIHFVGGGGGGGR